MGTITERPKRDGASRWTAQVRLAHQKSAAETFDTREAAEAWIVKREGAIRAVRDPNPKAADKKLAQRTVEDLYLEYIADPAVYRRRTHDDTSRTLTQILISQYGRTKLIDFGSAQIWAIRDKLAKKNKPGTVNRHMALIRAMLNWAIDRELIPLQGHIWPKKAYMPEPNPRPRFLTDDELERLMNAARPDATMHAAIIVALATGMRRGELLRLTWDDLDFKRETVTILETKTDVPRSVYLPEVAVEALKTLRAGKVAQLKGPVWTLPNGKPIAYFTFNARWLRIRKKAGLPKVRFHDLRHSCASYLVQAGASLPQVGQILGHSSPQVTMRYAQLLAGVKMTGHEELNAKLKSKK
jgi:integrase